MADMRSFHLEIVTPDGTAYDAAAQSLLLRTDDGDVELLAGHADYIGTVGTGRVRVRDAEGNDEFASASGGFITVSRGEVKLVATTFEFARDIDVNRAEAAAERARSAISSAKSDRDERVAKAKLARALNRINVSSLKG